MSSNNVETENTVLFSNLLLYLGERRESVMTVKELLSEVDGMPSNNVAEWERKILKNILTAHSDKIKVSLVHEKYELALLECASLYEESEVIVSDAKSYIGVFDKGQDNKRVSIGGDMVDAILAGNQLIRTWSMEDEEIDDKQRLSAFAATHKDALTVITPFTTSHVKSVRNLLMLQDLIKNNIFVLELVRGMESGDTESFKGYLQRVFYHDKNDRSRRYSATMQSMFNSIVKYNDEDALRFMLDWAVNCNKKEMGTLFDA